MLKRRFCSTSSVMKRKGFIMPSRYRALNSRRISRRALQRVSAVQAFATDKWRTHREPLDPSPLTSAEVRASFDVFSCTLLGIIHFLLHTALNLLRLVVVFHGAGGRPIAAGALFLMALLSV